MTLEVGILSLRILAPDWSETYRFEPVESVVRWLGLLKTAAVPVASTYPAVPAPAIVVTTAPGMLILRITFPAYSDAYKNVFVGSMHNPVTLLNLAAVPVPSVVANALLPAKTEATLILADTTLLGSDVVKLVPVMVNVSAVTLVIGYQPVFHLTHDADGDERVAVPVMLDKNVKDDPEETDNTGYVPLYGDAPVITTVLPGSIFVVGTLTVTTVPEPEIAVGVTDVAGAATP